MLCIAASHRQKWTASAIVRKPHVSRQIAPYGTKRGVCGKVAADAHQARADDFDGSQATGLSTDSLYKWRKTWYTDINGTLWKGAIYMGTHLNPGNDDFDEAIRSQIYVDKTGLIAYTNQVIRTKQKYVCVSRPRRFGKSMAADMLVAYYSRGCDSRELFSRFKIAQADSFEKHLNQYNVIRLNITRCTEEGDTMEQMLQYLGEDIVEEITEDFPDLKMPRRPSLVSVLERHFNQFKIPFVFIIDEWDCIFRMKQFTADDQVTYLNFLRNLLKDQSYVALAYMTGILPIKKYNTQSALNNFREYSMVQPRKMAGYFGFTKEEVRKLADKYGMDFEELKKWYDGYQIGSEPSMFNPNSVMQAIEDGMCDSYWDRTGAFETVSDYISMNFDGLKDDIIAMLAGESRPVDPTGFQNDLAIINNKDDALTVLIHLGYLSYDRREQECRIPNREVAGEMVNAVRAVKWKNVFDAIQKSKQLLRSTLDGDAEAVARGIDAAHDEETSILSYNNESSMACVLSIAYYYAKNDYIIHRELASGKGFADLVLLPRKNVDSPAIVIELKYDKDADTAIAQIKRKKYPAKVAQHTADLLLVGINYDKETKTHSCLIERWGGM